MWCTMIQVHIGHMSRVVEGAVSLGIACADLVGCERQAAWDTHQVLLSRLVANWGGGQNADSQVAVRDPKQ